jgi:A/G-specific adenine glycosylase
LSTVCRKPRPSEPVLPDAQWRRVFRRRLLTWFRRHARDLPWRRSRDPYYVWVSEIMLQQTQVATVVDYFRRFTAEFPTIDALAAADEQDVLRRWEGLGYYRRARNLHRAAALLAGEHAGRFPQDMEIARRLPGIGRYTAGAILSIAFDQPQPILEANTIRLHSRLLAYPGPTHTGDAQQLLWQLAAALLPRRGAGELNQALMELGATVCLPRQPRCEACPVASLCPTFQQGLQAEIPAARPKPRVEYVREAAVVVRRGGSVLLIKRGDGERWAGLWDFPRFQVSADSDVELNAELRAGVYALTGVSVEHQCKLGTIKHGVTRFRIALECHEARCLSRGISNGRAAQLRWVKPAELACIPLSVPARRLTRMIQ